MNDTAALVVSFLKLPPDEQVFLQIRDLYQTIKEKLDHLGLILAAAQDIRPSQDIAKTLEEFQDSAGAHCLKGVEVAIECKSYATSMAELAETLSTSSVDEDILLQIGSYSIGSEDIVQGCTATMQGMQQLSQEIPSTVGRISDFLNEGDNAQANLVFTETSLQLVNDLIKAVRDCAAAFRPVQSYFEEAREHFKNDDFFKKTSPVKAEISIMQQRWSGFAKSMEVISREIGRFRGNIRFGPDILKIPETARTQGGGSKSDPGAQDVPAARKAITAAGTDSTSADDAVAPSGPSVSRWRTWWRKVLSRLIPRYFRKVD
ncbi:hypothetical protein NP233_g9991 [Leucocoprinus birnbaumii]|uniref:Uncharacterized protein n=1 Tax=Leucocoprinus birnbaumii TaxID=56174 RepID=A0AAD5VJ65_9AGAR|nr:hypothetical protein NP233_g9991 [Leucocoprinus birnbaumii]